MTDNEAHRISLKKVFRSLTMIALPLTAPVVLSACSGGSTPEKQAEAKARASDSEAATEIAGAPEASQPKSQPVLTETDSIMLKQAEKACRNSEFRSFFEATLRSKPVRERYFTTPIKTEQGERLADSYNFPFQIVDTYYVTTNTASRTPKDWEHAVLDINQASDNRVRVDWVRIDYGPGGNDEGADDGGAQLADDKEYGPRGYLLFYPTHDCWELVKDGVEK
jgi:hypothetical protein